MVTKPGTAAPYLGVNDDGGGILGLGHRGLSVALDWGARQSGAVRRRCPNPGGHGFKGHGGHLAVVICVVHSFLLALHHLLLPLQTLLLKTKLFPLQPQTLLRERRCKDASLTPPVGLGLNSLMTAVCHHEHVFNQEPL